MRALSITLTLFAAALSGSGPRANPGADPGANPDDRPTVRSEEVTIDAGDVTLAGRLWLPAGPPPHPAMVFIPGSGRSIRDLELDPDPVPHHFAEMGIAFLAWDKRGVRDSGGEFVPLPDEGADAQLALLRRLAGDASAAMRHLASRPDIDADAIGVWAFSQGGWVASQLEAVGASPRFILVVGGPAVTIGEEARYSEIAGLAKEASRSGGPRVDLDEIHRLLETRREAGDDFGGYDPLSWLEALAAPTLFLLGSDDLSVPTRRSVARLTDVGRRNERIDHRVFPRANHGVATQDAAGVWHMAEGFYEVQLEFLANLGLLERRISIDTDLDREGP